MARPKEFDPEIALEAAMDLFWAKGYAATTPADLVEHLGIGRGSLYHTFHSKSSLYQQALERYRTQMNGRLQEILDDEGSPRARIARAVTAVVEHASSGLDDRGCLVTNAAVETAPAAPGIAALVTDVLDTQIAAFRVVLVEARALREIDPAIDPGEAAGFLVTFLNGVRVMQRAGTSPATLRPLADVALRAALGEPPRG